MFTFLHAADLHLDSPLVGLDRYEGAPADRIRGATRRALENLVDLAVAEAVAFVLVAGDLYDGDWPDYNTGLFLAKEMTRLRRAGIPVFVAAGNHDAASQLTRSLRLPDNVILLPTRSPATELLPELDVAIHGQGFPRRAVPEDLSARYPEARPGAFNIGLLHTSATGRAGHDVYAPCTVEGLRAKGYDYWALGHVHRREILHRDPWIVFSGNTQGRSVRETGAKGCTLVTVDEGRVAAVEHRDLDVLRWAVCRVDAAAAAGPEEVVAEARRALAAEVEAGGDRPLAVRVRVEGATPAHRELLAAPERWTSEIRAAATDASWGNVWVEKVQFHTRARTDLEEMVVRDDAFGDLLRFIRDLEAEQVGDLLAELAPLRDRLPAEVFDAGEGPAWGSPEHVHELLDEVKQLLLPRLLAGEEEGT